MSKLLTGDVQIQQPTSCLAASPPQPTACVALGHLLLIVFLPLSVCVCLFPPSLCCAVLCVLSSQTVSQTVGGKEEQLKAQRTERRASSPQTSVSGEQLDGGAAATFIQRAER